MQLYIDRNATYIYFISYYWCLSFVRSQGMRVIIMVIATDSQQDVPGPCLTVTNCQPTQLLHPKFAMNDCGVGRKINSSEKYREKLKIAP